MGGHRLREGAVVLWLICPPDGAHHLWECIAKVRSTIPSCIGSSVFAVRKRRISAILNISQDSSTGGHSVRTPCKRTAKNSWWPSPVRCIFAPRMRTRFTLARRCHWYAARHCDGHSKTSNAARARDAPSVSSSRVAPGTCSAVRTSRRPSEYKCRLKSVMEGL